MTPNIGVSMKKIFSFVFASLILASSAHARGRRGGNGEYAQVFSYLLSNHYKIEREVEFLDNGVKTLTTSSDLNVAKRLQIHVEQMKSLVESGRSIRGWDPLFAAIFEHYDLIEMEISPVENGIAVLETSYDPFVSELIKEHARVVSLFVQYGHEEARRAHPAP